MLSASDHRSSSSPSSGSPSPQEPDRPGRKNHRKPRGSGRENHGDRPGRKKPWGSGVRRRKMPRDFAGGGSVAGRSRYPRPPPGGPRSEFRQAMLLSSWMIFYNARVRPPGARHRERRRGHPVRAEGLARTPARGAVRKHPLQASAPEAPDCPAERMRQSGQNFVTQAMLLSWELRPG